MVSVGDDEEEWAGGYQGQVGEGDVGAVVFESGRRSVWLVAEREERMGARRMMREDGSR